MEEDPPTGQTNKSPPQHLLAASDYGSFLSPPWLMAIIIVPILQNLIPTAASPKFQTTLGALYSPIRNTLVSAQRSKLSTRERTTSTIGLCSFFVSLLGILYPALPQQAQGGSQQIKPYSNPIKESIKVQTTYIYSD